MARGGYIKLHRSIVDWEWFQDSNTYRLFTYLLMLANTEDKRWQGIEIKRGELATSGESLASALGLSRAQIRTSLRKLERSEITVLTTNQYTVVKINNYDTYQSREETEDDNTSLNDVCDKYNANTVISTNEIANNNASTIAEYADTITNDVTNEQPTDNQQIATIKKHKKHKKQEESIRERVTCPSPIPPDQVQFSEVVDMYNTSCQNMPKVKAQTELRRRAIRARWKNNRADPMAHFRELFTKAGRSSFLNGINDRAWSADFDWLMKEQNAVKVLEGKYDDNARAPAGLKPMQGAVRDKPETNAQRNARVAKELMLKFRAEEGNNGN